MSRVQHSGLVLRMFFHSLLVAPLVRIQDFGDAPTQNDIYCFAAAYVRARGGRRHLLDKFSQEIS